MVAAIASEKQRSIAVAETKMDKHKKNSNMVGMLVRFPLIRIMINGFVWENKRRFQTFLPYPLSG